MNVKLTLQLDKETIEKAKKLAKRRNQSLSSLVQNYFHFISENKEPDKIKISKNVKDISGIIKLDKKVNIKKEYKKHIMEKYS